MAFVLVPVLVAILVLESPGTRRAVIVAFVVLGVVVSTALLSGYRAAWERFASLWCLWAAVTSAAIALHLRLRPPDPSGLAVATGA